MTGKNKCKILKEIRKKIAQENDIPFITKECTFQGSCRGTCPKCEEELAYLEQQLARRQQLGKLVTVSALALGVTLGSVGCQPRTEVLEGDVPYVADTQEVWETTPGDPEPDATPAPNLRPSFLQDVEATATAGYTDTTEEIEMLEGDVAWTVDNSDEDNGDLMGNTEETGGE